MLVHPRSHAGSRARPACPGGGLWSRRSPRPSRRDGAGQPRGAAESTAQGPRLPHGATVAVHTRQATAWRAGGGLERPGVGEGRDTARAVESRPRRFPLLHHRPPHTFNCSGRCTLHPPHNIPYRAARPAERVGVLPCARPASRPGSGEGIVRRRKPASPGAAPGTERGSPWRQPQPRREHASWRRSATMRAP